MERLVELLARVLIAKGVDYAIAWAVAQEQAGAVLADNGAGCPGQCDPMAGCRMRGRADFEDECYAWDDPQFGGH